MPRRQEDLLHRSVFNNAAAAGISNVYSSPEDRTVGNTVGSFGEQLGVDMVGNELKEFWPDIRRKMFRKP